MTLVSILPRLPAENHPHPRRGRAAKATAAPRVRIDARGVRDRHAELRSVEVEPQDPSRTKRRARKPRRRDAPGERKAEKTIRRIVATIPEAAVIHASDDGTIVEANQRFEAIAHPGAAKPLVLVVDADPETRVGMTETLQAQYEVVTAATEPEARALLAEHVGRIAIILMDAALGGIDDGLRFAKRLRDEATWRDVPIMATIPHALPEYEKTALAAGCNGYLVKLSRLEPTSPESPATDLEERPFRPRPVGSLPRIDWRVVCRRVIRRALR